MSNHSITQLKSKFVCRPTGIGGVDAPAGPPRVRRGPNRRSLQISRIIPFETAVRVRRPIVTAGFYGDRHLNARVGVESERAAGTEAVGGWSRLCENGAVLFLAFL
ncbi:hypothetical protein EVAR_28520_1 [Eumeta japonica]|uniref:Uncharacterized protein n=1 Tax=Eumeta variegata TaxID=151549 RepID=A0A4C1WST4_EUMVA|nr:hypothetical protein EVAR_28520_1 [Eumeta japonica]